MMPAIGDLLISRLPLEVWHKPSSVTDNPHDDILFQSGTFSGSPSYVVVDRSFIVLERKHHSPYRAHACITLLSLCGRCCICMERDLNAFFGVAT